MGPVVSIILLVLCTTVAGKLLETKVNKNTANTAMRICGAVGCGIMYYSDYTAEGKASFLYIIAAVVYVILFLRTRKK